MTANYEINENIRLISGSCTGCSLWTSGNDIEIEGQYVWDYSNMKFGFFYWAPGEPSIANPSQATTRDCIDIYRTGKWNDRPCDYYTSFICEKNATKWSDSSVRVYFFNGFSYPNLLILMSISEFNKNIPWTPVPGNHNYFSDSNPLRKCSGSVHAHIGARFLINRVL